MGRDLGIAALLAASVFAVYAQSAGFERVRYDDPVYVAGSSHLREGLSAEGIAWAFSGPFASNYFPLTLVSHMLDRSVHGDDYGGHHTTSVLLHALNALLLFWVLRSATGARTPSALAALLFAVHPMNVESVAWIAERKNVLSTTFWLLVMASHVSYARRGGWLRYAATAAWFACGLLCKPMVVTLPFALLLLDYWPLDRVGSPRAKPSEDRLQKTPAILLLEKLPLLALSAAASWMTLRAQVSTIEASSSLDWGARAGNAVFAYASYLGKLVWPSSLALHYPHPNLPAAGGTPLATWEIAGATGLLAALTAFALLGRRRRYPLVGWLWFLGVLVPTIGAVQVGSQAYADRYTYLPAIGLFVVVAWAGTDALSARRARVGLVRAGVLGAVVAFVALASVAFHQTRYWANSISLFERSLDVAPRNPKIRFNLANVYRDAGQFEEAIRHYRLALQVDPEAVNVRINLATALRAKGDVAAAVAEYANILDREPDNATVHNNLATLFRLAGQPLRAVAHYRYAINLEPHFARAHYNLANVLGTLSQHEKAITHYRLALEFKPDDAKAQNNLGIALSRLKRYDEAIEAHRRAIALQPDHHRAHNNLGLLLARRGNLDEAIRHYRRALESSPDYANAHVNLGDALRAQGRNRDAIAAYRAGAATDPGSDRAKRKLADALTEAGQPAE